MAKKRKKLLTGLEYCSVLSHMQPMMHRKLTATYNVWVTQFKGDYDWKSDQDHTTRIEFMDTVLHRDHYAERTLAPLIAIINSIFFTLFYCFIF